MMDKLELLALTKDFTIKKCDNGYEVSDNNSDLSAYISEEKTTYYLTGLYNTGVDWHEIEIESLDKLKKICELLTK